MVVLIALVIGVCAGAAGALGIATGVSAALVGVMIAAALIPAAAAVGIGIVWSAPTIAFGALVLLVVNAASIHVSGVLTLWYLGYRPPEWNSESLLANVSLHRFGSSMAVAVVLLALFVGAGGLISTHIVFERTANLAVEETLEDERYSALELAGVQAEFNLVAPFSQSQEVVITVRRTADETHPELGDRIRDRIIEETDRKPDVRIVFVESQRAPDGSANGSASRSVHRSLDRSVGRARGPIA